MIFAWSKRVLVPVLLLASACDGELRHPDVPGEDMLICPELLTGRDVLFPGMGQTSLVGDTLYVPIVRDGKASVRVLRLGDGTVEEVGEAEGLEGYPLEQGWQHVTDARYARFHDGEFEVIDARDPLSPKRDVWSMGTPTQFGERVFGQSGTRLFACVEVEGEGRLAFVDIAGPPSEPTLLPSSACRDPWVSMLASSSGLWAELTWSGEEKEWEAVTIYSLEDGAALASHVVEGETVWTRLVVGESFVALWPYDEQTLELLSPGADVPVSLPNPGFFQFLVHDVGYAVQFGYSSTPLVRIVDLRDVDEVVTTELELLQNPLFDGYGYVMQTAYDDERLVVITEVGDVWVVPFGTTAAPEPLMWVNENGNAVCPGQ